MHYRDKIDAGEDEVTLQKRHLSELNRHHRSEPVLGLAQPELAWNVVHIIMTKQYGTYPTSQELEQFMDLIRERLQPDYGKVPVYHMAFSHLMFDRVYCEALRANGLEPYEATSPLPAIPAGLSDATRRQWIADFETLVAHALMKEVKQPKTLNTSAVKPAIVKDLKKMAPPSEVRSASKASQEIANEFVQKFLATFEKLSDESVKSKNACLDDRPRTSASEKSPSAHNVSAEVRARKANRELYAANKKLYAENASTKAKLDRTTNTLNKLTSKIVVKTQRAAAGTGNTVQRLNAAVVALLDHSANFQPTDEQKSEAGNQEILLLDRQLVKLGQSNEQLQKQLLDLREELTTARQQKKNEAKTPKSKNA